MDDLDRLLAELDGIEDPRGPVPRQSVRSQLNLAELDRLVEDFEQVTSRQTDPKPQVAPASPKPQPIVQPATPTSTKHATKPVPKTEPQKFESSNYTWRHEAKGSSQPSTATPQPSSTTTSQPSTATPPQQEKNATKTPSDPTPVKQTPATVAPTQPTPAKSGTSQPTAPVTAPITKSSSSSSPSSTPASTPSTSTPQSSPAQPSLTKSPSATSNPPPQSPVIPVSTPQTPQPTGGSGIGSKDTSKKDLRHSKRVSVFALKPINRDDVCASCGYNVKGEHVVALGKIFHTNHFTCSTCGLQLSNDFFEHDGKPSCGQCMEKFYSCCKCGKGIEAEYFEMDGMRFHGGCLDRGSCARCGKGISSAETSALGKNYHPECFTCSGCGIKLDGSFFAKNNEPFCPRCASTKTPVATGGLVACAVCKQQVIGTYVTFNYENYHSQCFTCVKCHQPLPTDSFYIIKQQFHCEPCAKS